MRASVEVKINPNMNRPTKRRRCEPTRTHAHRPTLVGLGGQEWEGFGVGCGVELGSDLRALCQAVGRSDEGLASDSLHHHNHPYHLHHHHHHHALNQSNPSLTAACRLRASRVWHPPARRSRNASSTSLAPAVTRVAGATNARANKKKKYTQKKLVTMANAFTSKDAWCRV